MKSIESVKETVNKVDGIVSDAEGEFLYHAAKSCRGQGVIVEIGSFKGKSTIWLAKGSKAGKNLKVYAIDPFTEFGEHKKSPEEISIFEEFKKNIKSAGVDDIVVPIVGTSEEAVKGWDKPVELLWIDGAHEYEMVKLDFELWEPYLIDGGFIAFHDTIWEPGPKKVVEESICKSRRFKNVGLVGGITFARKTSINSLSDRLRSKYILFLIDIQEMAWKMNLPRPIRVIGKGIIRVIH